MASSKRKQEADVSDDDDDDETAHVPQTSNKRQKFSPTHDEDLVKMKELLAANYRNEMCRRITWVAYQVFEDHMHQIVQNLFYSRESVFTIMFCSPCRFTRTHASLQCVRTLTSGLHAIHHQLHFKYNPNMVKGEAHLIETRKEMDDKVREWCEKLVSGRRISLRDEGIIRLNVKGFMILEIPEAHTYTPTELDHKLKLIHGALFKHQRLGSKVLVVLHGNYAPQKIRELALEARKQNPPSVILTKAESALEIRPDPWSHATAANAVEDILRTTLPCTVFPLPPAHSDTLAFYYAERVRDTLYAQLNKFAYKVQKSQLAFTDEDVARLEKEQEEESDEEDFPVAVPVEVGFVLSQLYPSSDDESLMRFFSELDRITSRLKALAEERHKARRYFDRCSVSMSEEKSLDFVLGHEKVYSFTLPKAWPFDPQTLDSTREHVKELQATHNWEISDNCIDAISQNVSIMSGNTGDSDFRNHVAQKAILDNATPFLQNAVVTYNPQNSVLSLSQNHISFGHAIINILSDQQRRIAEIEAKQKEQDEKQRLQDLEQQRIAAEVREIREGKERSQSRNIAPDLGPKAGAGGIYLLHRKGQTPAYVVQYRSNGVKRSCNIPTRIVHGGSPSHLVVEALRKHAAEFGLSHDAIERSLIRMQLL